MKTIDVMMLSIVIIVLLMIGLFNLYMSYNKEQITLPCEIVQQQESQL